MLKDDVSHDIIEICWNKKLKLDSFERPNKFLFQMWGLATSQQTTFHLMTLGVILTHDLALALEQFRLYIKAYFTWAVLLAQLVEHLIRTPEIRGSNPVISNIIYYQHH